MDDAALLLELYGRIPPLVAAAVDGLSADELARSPEPGAASFIEVGSKVSQGDTLLIIEAGRNSIRGAQAALNRLEQGGARIVGAVLTKFDPSRFGYGQGDAYGYNYSYDYAEK